MSVKKTAMILAVTVLLFAPALAQCEVCDASGIEIDEAKDTTDGFKFGQQPEKNGLTVAVLIILTLILVIVAVLMLRLRKKMNGGHY